MSKLVLAHLSDLHVSTFGDTFHDGFRLVRRSGRPLAVPAEWTCIHQENGWSIVHPPGKPKKLRLRDHELYEHAIPRASQLSPEPDLRMRAVARLRALSARTSSELARNPPDAQQLEQLFKETPKNANVRLLRAVAALEREHVDAVIVTGDLTDHGTGYELLLSAFAPWIARGMFFCVPGNHDLYRFPIAGSTRPKRSVDEKRLDWAQFYVEAGVRVGPEGAWLHTVHNTGVVIAGLNSCIGPQRRFFRHDGALGAEQMAWLKGLRKNPEWRAARVRLVAFHHHLDKLAVGIGKGHAPELGLKLSDAKEAASVINDIGATAVLHGHRHVSERRQPAGSHFEIFAASSTTLGCRSGDEPSYWRLEMGDGSFDASRCYTSEPAVPMSIPPRAFASD